MIAALDTNIISVLWSEEPGWQNSLNRLHEVSTHSTFVICPAVFAELHAEPLYTPELLDGFVEDLRVRVSPMTPEMWADAGRRYGEYARRRRREGTGQPRRLLTDFIIGSHALLHADALMTDDTRMYRTNFPELKLV